MNILPIDKLLLAKTYTCLVVFRFVIFKSEQSFHGLYPVFTYEAPFRREKSQLPLSQNPVRSNNLLISRDSLRWRESTVYEYKPCRNSRNTNHDQ